MNLPELNIDKKNLNLKTMEIENIKKFNLPELKMD